MESIIRVDHWWHLPKMAGRFVDKLETNLFLDFIVDIRVSLPPKVRGRVWAPTFACFAFFTVATVGPTKLCASHKLTKGDTCRKVLNNSSGNPVNIGS